MTQSIKEIFEDLQNCIDRGCSEEEFLDMCEDKIKILSKIDNKFEAIDYILKLFENNPSYYFGMPGDLVRFVENFFKRGYEKKLIESINRRPTKHTLWMLNRIINGVSDDEKDNLISLLENVENSTNLDKEIINVAREFKELHKV